MLKEAKYRNRGYPVSGSPEFNKVAYLIKDNCCYFSGLERGSSTINEAEEVITSIAKQENVPFNSLRYFDIQTYKGYPGRLSGSYVINELKFEMRRVATEEEQVEYIEKRFGCTVIESNLQAKKSVEECEIIPSVTEWISAILPDDVLNIFQEHIGVDLKTMYTEIALKEQERFLVVRDSDNLLLFVHPNGTPAFSEKYTDVTPFWNDVAWVTKGNDQWLQIDNKGNIKSGPVSGKELWPT